jgi:hypothetical protein
MADGCGIIPSAPSFRGVTELYPTGNPFIEHPEVAVPLCV